MYVVCNKRLDHRGRCALPDATAGGISSGFPCYRPLSIAVNHPHWLRSPFLQFVAIKWIAMDAVSQSHSSLPCSPLSSAFSAISTYQLFSSFLLPIITVSRFPSSPAQAACHYHGRPSHPRVLEPAARSLSISQSPPYILAPNHSP